MSSNSLRWNMISKWRQKTQATCSANKLQIIRLNLMPKLRKSSGIIRENNSSRSDVKKIVLMRRDNTSYVTTKMPLLSNLKQNWKESSKKCPSWEKMKKESSSWPNWGLIKIIKSKLTPIEERVLRSLKRKSVCLKRRKEEGYKTSNRQSNVWTLHQQTKLD